MVTRVGTVRDGNDAVRDETASPGLRSEDLEERKSPLSEGSEDGDAGRFHVGNDDDFEFSQPIGYRELSDGERRPGCWERYRWRIASLAGACASVVFAASNWGPKVRTLGSLGVGFFVNGALNSGPMNPPERRKVAQKTQTVFGQFTEFVLSQLFYNARLCPRAVIPIVEEAAILSIVGLGGANVQNVAQSLWIEGLNREEYHDLEGVQGERLGRLSPDAKNVSRLKRWVGKLQSEKLSWIVKSAVSGGLLTLSHGFSKELDHPVVEQLANALALFFISQTAAELILTGVNYGIKTTSKDKVKRFCKMTYHSMFRHTKTMMATLPLFAFLAYIPWRTKPSADERKMDLIWNASVLGIVSGIADRCKIDRLNHCAARSLSELEKIQSGPYWKWGVPICTSASMIGFTLWQIYAGVDQGGIEAGDRVSKYSIIVNTVAFVSTMAFSKGVDWNWDIEKTNYWKDKAMRIVTFDSRVFGVDPFIFYYLVTNSIEMDSRSMEKDQIDFNAILQILAWGAFGFASAREVHRTSSERVGGRLVRFPELLLANSAMTAYPYWDGRLR